MRCRSLMASLLLLAFLTIPTHAQDKGPDRGARGAVLGAVIGAAAGAAAAALVMTGPCEGGAYEDRALCTVVTPVGLVGGGLAGGYFIGRSSGPSREAVRPVAPAPSASLSPTERQRLAASVTLRAVAAPIAP